MCVLREKCPRLARLEAAGEGWRIKERECGRMAYEKLRYQSRYSGGPEAEDVDGMDLLGGRVIPATPKTQKERLQELLERMRLATGGV